MDAILEATTRDTFGKNEARRTRREGRVPAVVYGAATEGASREAMAIAVLPKPLLKILHSEAGANSLISLKVEGSRDAKVLVREYQLDPVTHAVLHVDFYRVRMDKLLQITIPIVVKGDPKVFDRPDMNAQKQIFIRHRIINKDGKPGTHLTDEKIEPVEAFAAKLNELKK